MPDTIEVIPQPSAPTTPAMTPDSRAADKALAVSPPGAGGWTPKQMQVVALSCLAAGVTAALDLVSGTGDFTPKALGVAFGKGAIAALMTFLGLKSAGPRKLTE